MANRLDALRQDLRSAVRALRKAPGYALAVALVLGLGLGGTTAIFAVVNAVLLRPLPIPESNRLGLIRESFPRMGLLRTTIGPAELIGYRERAAGFVGIGGFENWNLTLTEGTRAERLLATRVTANLFPLLRVSPLVGRTFLPAEETPGNERVVILSHELWTRRFGAERAVIGRTIQLDGSPYQVVGVMGAELQFPLPGIIWSRPADVWVPLAYPPETRAAPLSSFNTHALVRLGPGGTFAGATASVTAALRQMIADNPGRSEPGSVETVEVVPLSEEVQGSIRGSLLLLLGATAFVLLIACANVAHLMLVRAGRRRTELAIRAALGAGRGRIVSQLVVESVLLGLLGGVVGLIVAAVGTELLVALRPADLPRIGETRVGWTVLGFGVALAALTGFGVGLRPALVAARGSVGASLRHGRRVAAGSRRRGGLLVSTEVALAIVLLVGTGLLLRSLANVERVDPGLAADGLLFARAYPPEIGYPTGGQVNRFYDRLIDRVRAIPGVADAAVSSTMVVDDRWSAGYAIEDAAKRGEPLRLRVARNTVIGAGYFGTLGIPFVRGRAFDGRDRAGSPLVVIVNRTMAELNWPGIDPIGQRLSWGAPAPDRWRTVVGVVADAKESGREAGATPTMYVPLYQANSDTTSQPLRSLVVAIRAARDPATVTEPLRAAVAALDPAVALDGVRPVRQIYASELAPRRFVTGLVSLFGLAAAALAWLGLYGVLSHQVAERRPEIGVRLALGASPAGIVRSVVQDGLGFTGLGILAGALLAVPLTGLVGKLLFGIGRFDPVTFLGGALGLLLAALLATYWPARRAARVDPVTALRGD